MESGNYTIVQLLMRYAYTDFDLSNHLQVNHKHHSEDCSGKQHEQENELLGERGEFVCI